jgi:uncharacterized protein
MPVFLSLLEHLPALAVGAALGFFGGMFGIGGGIIAIPMFVIGYGMDQPLAQGTALVMMVPNLLVGWWRYSQRHPVPVGRALTIGALAAATTWVTAHFANALDPAVLKAIFATFLLLLAVNLLVRRRTPGNDAAPRVGPRFMPVVGLLGGSCMGLLGVGGGLVATPLFTSLFGLRQTVAQAFSLALVTPSSVIALLVYANAQRVDWAQGLPMAASGLLTVSAGVAFAHRLPEKKMRAAFAWMVLLTAIWLLASPLVLR